MMLFCKIGDVVGGVLIYPDREVPRFWGISLILELETLEEPANQQG